MNIGKFINEQLPFLHSSRFWQVVVAVGLVLAGYYGLVPAEVANAIASILGVSVTIRTIDKISE